ncbi:M24 family metallopeptidase [Bacillus taeanensis]|uniref:Aminopeptidase P family protein n=1 Tax=Bacillus taeanensis TaxID=273032 RepID=A0A366XUB9_9BACI|nr:M24 family metallopeptidase [Bacillus taeanensis]RBW69732.1 aminopeptidase P family protein [Bacillus taeanensis]
MQNFENKLERVHTLIREENIDGILFTQQKNVSWLTGGRSFVNTASEKAVAFILVTPASNCLIVSNIEAERLIDEEVKCHFDCIEVYPWYEPQRIDEFLAKEGTVQSDITLEHKLVSLRTVLTSEDEIQLRVLGKDTAAAIERTTFELKQGETEYEIAARLAKNCIEREIEPIVNLVAVDERVYSRRHPLPTSLALKNYAMLVVCGRRNGQVVSATRLVHFGTMPRGLVKRHRAVVHIDAAMIANTTPNASFSDVFEVMKHAYQEEGFGEEWKFHHQGGLSGYNTREQLLLPNDSNNRVAQGQVYAWNPSIAGVKSEDTIFIGENGTEIISYSGEFPMIEVNASGKKLLRPDILIR